MKSITFIIPNLGMGGAENALVILANEWVKTANISIVTFDTGKTFFKIDERVKIIPLDTTKREGIFSSLANGFRRLRRLPVAISKTSPDVTMAIMDTSIIWTFFSRFRTKVPLIMVFQVTPSKPIIRSFFRPLMKILYQKADAAVLLTHTMEEVFKKLEIELPEQVFIIPNPVSKSSIFDGEVKREDVIMGVGRLRDQKQFNVLIKIFHQLQPTNWQLWIVGEGENRKSLEDLIQQYNLGGKVLLLGGQTNVSQYYARAKVFALSSSHEGFPLVLCEAMSNGCACISFDCETGPSDIIQHKVDGVLIEDQNVDSFVEELRGLIADPYQITEYAEKARNFFDKVNIEKLIYKWDDVVETVLKSDAKRKTNSN